MIDRKFKAPIGVPLFICLFVYETIFKEDISLATPPTNNIKVPTQSIIEILANIRSELFPKIGSIIHTNLNSSSLGNSPKHIARVVSI